MNLWVEYKGYKIWQTTRNIAQKSPLSGHQWNDIEVVRNSYYISGKGARVGDTFRSLQAAKNHVDFLIRVEEIVAKVA